MIDEWADEQEQKKKDKQFWCVEAYVCESFVCKREKGKEEDEEEDEDAGGRGFMFWDRSKGLCFAQGSW